MKRNAILFGLIAIALFAFAAWAGDTLTYVGTTTPPTTVSQGVRVTGASGITVTVSDFRDGGVADIGGLKSLDAKAWKWTDTPGTPPINGAGSWNRMPELDIRYTDDNDAGTGLAVNPSPKGTSSSLKLNAPLYGRILYTTVFNDIDGGTDSHIVTIESH